MHYARSSSIQAIFAGVLAGFVGFASSFAIIVQGLKSVGATDAEATSGLMVLAIAMGVGGVILSLKTKMPISVAWSTPGAALLVSTGAVEGGFSGAVGAFSISALLLLAAGIWKPLGRAVAAIPAPLANAMLAGILLHLCLAPFQAIASKPVEGLILVVVWAVTARFKRLFAVPAAFVALVLLNLASATSTSMPPALLIPHPIFILPNYSINAVISIGIPLFIVTMASQNIPGIAVLAIHGFNPKAGPLFTVTGLLSLISAPFGGHAVNLAAITAAMCAGPDAHADPRRRYWAGVSSGLTYIFLGFMAAGATVLIRISAPVLIESVAGLALIGAFGASMNAAVSEPKSREAAILTFIISASGLSLFGIGGAFWGLLAGWIIFLLREFRTTA